MRAQIVIITDASNGIGRLAANAVAQSGHTVYAALRAPAGRDARLAKDLQACAREEGIDVRPLELDAASQPSVDQAIGRVVAAHGGIDIVVHNAGEMAFGPAEAFTPEQFAELYDANVLSAQRVNRGVLPYMRRRGRGLLVWVSSSSAAGGTPSHLSPYLAAKAAMDALAVQYAFELARWGIETSIVVAGAFVRGTGDFDHARAPADAARVAEYDAGPTAGLADQSRAAFFHIVPGDADPGAIAGAISGLVDTPFGERPFRVHVDPGDDGAAVAFGVIDRVRAEMLHRVGLPDLLKPASRRSSS